jgi:hypothetical protein
MSRDEYKNNYVRKQEEADGWQGFHSRFMQLAREEQGRAEAEPVITKGKVLRSMDQVLRASCNYSKHPEGWERGKPEQGRICLLDTPPHGVWNYTNDGISENFFERVRLCVAEAGRALPDYPRGADPEDFWLHRLRLDLLKNNSDLLFAASEAGGMIISVCVASATFCSRLERNALEQAEPGDQSLPSRPIERGTSEATEKRSPFDQNENLHNAILKKKARIVEIERILNRPPVTEHRGRPRSSSRGLVEDWLEADAAKFSRPRPKMADKHFHHLTAELWTDVSNSKKTTQTVELEVTRPHFGGVRFWFRCPACQARRRKLYAYDDFLDSSPRPYACRVCLNLFYVVQYRKSTSAIRGRALRAFLKACEQSSLPRSVQGIRRWCKQVRQFSNAFGIPELLQDAQRIEETLDWEAQVLNEDRPS